MYGALLCTAWLHCRVPHDRLDRLTLYYGSPHIQLPTGCRSVISYGVHPKSNLDILPRHGERYQSAGTRNASHWQNSISHGRKEAAPKSIRFDKTCMHRFRVAMKGTMQDSSSRQDFKEFESQAHRSYHERPQESFEGQSRTYTTAVIVASAMWVRILRYLIRIFGTGIPFASRSESRLVWGNCRAETEATSDLLV